MAAKTETHHSCDRCGDKIVTVIGDEYNQPGPASMLQEARYISLKYTDLSENKKRSCDWTELCDRCQLMLRVFFFPSENQPGTISESREAYNWFLELVKMHDDAKLNDSEKHHIRKLFRRAFILLGRRPDDPPRV